MLINRNLHIIVLLILCLCMLTSCTAANPALDEADMPPAGEVDRLGDNTDMQQDGDEQAQPSGNGDIQPSGNGDTRPSGSRDIQPGENLSDTGSDVKPAEADINAVDRIRHALLKDDPLVVNDELVESFFNYYMEDHGYRGPYHRYELRALPDFGNKTKLDWDGLVLFAFMLSQHETNAEGYSYMPKETFEKTVNRLFSDLEYTHRSSSLFDFADDRYTATGWDYHGGMYYRLREISRNSDGMFKASFDGFSFHELDSFEEQYDHVSENMKALFDYAGEIKAETRRSELVLEIFLRDDYSEIMHVDQRVDITFKLSDDPEFAFKYLSCKREWIE